MAISCDINYVCVLLRAVSPFAAGALIGGLGAFLWATIFLTVITILILYELRRRKRLTQQSQGQGPAPSNPSVQVPSDTESLTAPLLSAAEENTQTFATPYDQYVRGVCIIHVL